MEEKLNEIITKLDVILGILKRRHPNRPAVPQDLDRIEAFVKDRCAINSVLYITSRDFHDQCKLSQKAIPQYMATIGVKPVRRMIDQKQVRCWQGIGWKNQTDF